MTEITITITLGPWVDDPSLKYTHRRWVSNVHKEQAITIWECADGTFHWEIYDLSGDNIDDGEADTMALAKDAAERELAVWAKPVGGELKVEPAAIACVHLWNQLTTGESCCGFCGAVVKTELST